MQREPVANRLGEVRFVFNDEYANDSSLGRLCGWMWAAQIVASGRQPHGGTQLVKES